MMKALLCTALVTVLVMQASAISQSVYLNSDCSGSPLDTFTYQGGVCNMGGLVYSCIPNVKCLELRVFNTSSTLEGSSASGSGSCSGTPTSTSAFVCDQCTGGSDTLTATVVRGCSTPHPAIMTCSGDGWCDSGATCTSDGNLTTGCFDPKGDGTAVDTRVVSCSAVMMQVYADYQSCSGQINTQTVFSAGICQDGMLWSC